MLQTKYSLDRPTVSDTPCLSQIVCLTLHKLACLNPFGFKRELKIVSGLGKVNLGFNHKGKVVVFC